MRKVIGSTALVLMLFGNGTTTRGQEPIEPVADPSHIAAIASLRVPSLESASQSVQSQPVQPAKAPHRKRFSLKTTLITLAVVAGVLIVIRLSVPYT